MLSKSTDEGAIASRCPLPWNKISCFLSLSCLPLFFESFQKMAQVCIFYKYLWALVNQRIQLSWMDQQNWPVPLILKALSQSSHILYFLSLFVCAILYIFCPFVCVCHVCYDVIHIVNTRLILTDSCYERDLCNKMFLPKTKLWSIWLQR